MIDKHNNPWLGLSSYQTSDSFRFFGREREMEEIGASIKDNYCTILYGVSGAGKTSIINAGLCPKLSAEGYLPITIRLDHNGQSYSDQIISACFHTFEQTETEYECPFDAAQIQSLDARDALWIFFHASTFWSKDNRKIVPVLFIDQFEEIFTLTGSEDQTISFFQQIDSLFGSVPSDRLILQLESSNTSFDFSETPQFRMVLSMREDFLARLEDYCYNLPILRRNRIGLRKMNGFQALDVIMKPQRGLVAEDVALKIVSTVTGKDCSSNRTNLQMLSVDTSILSLFCSELYQLSADKNADVRMTRWAEMNATGDFSAEKNIDVITSDIVETEGGDIIKRFYEKNVSKLSRRGRRYLEQHLLTSGGFRNQLAVEDINRTLVSESDIQALESSRIIRKEIINGTERIEFTHDILCKAAMESMRKAKERNIKFSSFATYAAFTIVCTYIVKHTVSFIAEDLCLLWKREPGMSPISISTIIGLNIRYILPILYGFLYLPLSTPTTRKKNKFVDICLIFFGIILAVFAPHLYRTINTRCILTWAGWVLLLTIVPFINICSRAPRSSFKEYCNSVFKLPLNVKDKGTGVVINIVLLWGIYKVFREFRYLFLSRLENSKFIIVIACFLAAIIIFFLFFIVISALVQPYRKQEKKKLTILLGALQVCFTFLYLLSQYSHARWISYSSLAALFGISLYGLHKYIISFWNSKNYVKLSGSIAAVFLFFIGANFISNINILALRDNARDIEHKHCWEQPKIVSLDGHYGIMEGSNVIVPPIYKSISDDYDNHWNYSLGRRYSGFGRISTGIIRLLNKRIYNYRVCNDDGCHSSWCIMEHPEIDNKYSRLIPKYAKEYSTDSYITRLAIDYYYQKAVVEKNAKYKDDFYIACERLFFLCLGETEMDKSQIASALSWFYLKDSSPSNKFMLRCITKKEFEGYRGSLRIPESPGAIYNALKCIIQSKAVKSNELINDILHLVDCYNDIEQNIAKVKCKALLCLIQGNYSDAVYYAKFASDDETLVEALILSRDIDDLDLINSLSVRTDDEGRLLGEKVFDELYYLLDEDKPLAVPNIIARCASLPQIYKESVSLDRTRLRRTLTNGEVFFIESGKIISQYKKIVYPINAYANSLGVYYLEGRRGYIDNNGGELTGAIFNHAWLFSEHNGLAVVESDGKIGFINNRGKYVVYPSIPMPDELRYYKDWIFEADGHLVFPGRDRKFGLLDSNGKWSVYPQYGEIGNYCYGFRVFGDSVSGKYGLLNRFGKVVIPQEYQTIDIDSKYIEVRDSNYVISYYKHDGNKIIGKVLERE